MLVLVLVVFVSLNTLQTPVGALPDREQVVDVEVELPRLVLELRLRVDRLNLYDILFTYIIGYIALYFDKW